MSDIQNGRWAICVLSSEGNVSTYFINFYLIDSRELNGKGKKTHFMNTQLLLASLHKKLSFLLQIFLVNMNKSLMEKFIFCALPQDPAVLNVDRKAFMKQLGYNAWLLQFTEFIPYISCLC